ncbi:MAG: gephyrin-like molybdotransferase receptor GlpR, partial [Mycobacterium sp.]
VEESEAYDAFAGTDHDYEYEEEDDSTGLEAQTDDDVPMAVSMSQARRRRYDSTTAAAVSARKYKFRKRTLMAMTVLMTVLGAVSYLVSPTLWWVCGSLGIVTLLYLGYLRRQTRIEERVRRRRSQRMMRARLGVENTHDEEFDVVPSRLRRPGAVVLEIDDEDPIFEHLDYAPVAREYDLPRAAGQ